MIRNYLKTSIRNLLRYKTYSIINVIGLTAGLSITIFIFLWVMDEMSYDQFHKNKERIFRVMGNFIYNDGSIETGSGMPAKLAETMQGEVPEIEHTIRVSWQQGLLVRYEEKAFYEQGFYVDSTFFKVFSFPITHGDATTPLADLTSIAISQRLATKLFGNDEPTGKVIHIAQKIDAKVTAVFSDVPQNSTLKFDYVLPIAIWLKENPWTEKWGVSSMQTFATLKPGASLVQANEKIANLVKKNCEDCLNHPFLFPYASLHLNGEFTNGKNTGGRIEYVKAFSFVAIIILLIACFNFMNLATARSSTRSREVGIRKAIGAQRFGLITQFIAESVLLSFIAMIFALAFVQLLLPFFNQLTDKSIDINFQDPTFAAGVICITGLSGITAGSYPAFFLSSFKPSIVLKGVTQSALSGGSVRKTLVVLQFTLSVILIVGSIVVYNQITFIRNMHLGFDKENIILLDQFANAYKNQHAYKNELLQHPNIVRAGISGDNPFDIHSTTTDPAWPGKPAGSDIPFKVVFCDQDFIPTVGMSMIAGRNFSDNYKQDSTNYIVNEKAMQVMELTEENVIGSELDMWNGKGKIIGLVKDFNNGTLRKPIEPLIFLYTPENTWRIFVKVEGDVRDALAHMERVQKKFDPDYPFEYDFLDEKFDKEYRNEAVIGKLSLSFTALAVIISCLGLLGLASFTAERRTKELGIRKVLGATVVNLVIMLCSDFSRLIMLGLLLGFPIAWYLSNEFLSGYAFHAELSQWIFIITGITVISLALIIVGYQAAKAAMENPVKSLRSE